MPIPAATSHDLFLRCLLDKQVTDLDGWVDVRDVVGLLPYVDRHSNDAGEALPESVWRDIEYLEGHRLLEFRPDNPHVRLTPSGVYTALLFEVDTGR